MSVPAIGNCISIDSEETSWNYERSFYCKEKQYHLHLYSPSSAQYPSLSAQLWLLVAFSQWGGEDLFVISKRQNSLKLVPSQKVCFGCWFLQNCASLSVMRVAQQRNFLLSLSSCLMGSSNFVTVTFANSPFSFWHLFELFFLMLGKTFFRDFFDDLAAPYPSRQYHYLSTACWTRLPATR